MVFKKKNIHFINISRPKAIFHFPIMEISRIHREFNLSNEGESVKY